MTSWAVVWEWVLSGLVQNFAWMIVAILFVQFVQRAYENRKYGGWRVIVRKDGEELVNRGISTGKMKEIMNEPSEMSVFVKGVASPYDWIECDIVTEGRRNGLLVEDGDKRRLLIDLDNNPKKKDKPRGEIARAGKKKSVSKDVVSKTRRPK